MILLVWWYYEDSVHLSSNHRIVLGRHSKYQIVTIWILENSTIFSLWDCHTVLYRKWTFCLWHFILWATILYGKLCFWQKERLQLKMLPLQLLKCSRVKVRLDCFVFPPACCFTALRPHKRRRWCCTNFSFQPTRLVTEVCFCFVVLLDWDGKRMFVEF